MAKLKQRIKLTDEIAIGHRKHMLKKHRAKIRNPRSVWNKIFFWRKWVINRYLKKIGITEKVDDFIDNFAFVIGNVIWCSFVKTLTPERSVFLITHEIQHVIDQRAENPVVFLARYAGDDNFRVESESRSYLAEAELTWWQLGVLLNARATAERLRPYYVGNKGINYCERLLLSYLPVVKRGVITTQAGRDTIEYLKGVA